MHYRFKGNKNPRAFALPIAALCLLLTLPYGAYASTAPLASTDEATSAPWSDSTKAGLALDLPNAHPDDLPREVAALVAEHHLLVNRYQSAVEEESALLQRHSAIIGQMEELRSGGEMSLLDSLRLRRLRRNAQELDAPIHLAAVRREELLKRILHIERDIVAAVEQEMAELGVLVRRYQHEHHAEDQTAAKRPESASDLHQRLRALEQVMAHMGERKAPHREAILTSSEGSRSAPSADTVPKPADGPDELRELADELRDEELRFRQQATHLAEMIDEMRARVALGRLSLRMEREGALLDESMRMRTFAVNRSSGSDPGSTSPPEADQGGRDESAVDSPDFDGEPELGYPEDSSPEMPPSMPHDDMDAPDDGQGGFEGGVPAYHPPVGDQPPPPSSTLPDVIRVPHQDDGVDPMLSQGSRLNELLSEELARLGGMDSAGRIEHLDRLRRELERRAEKLSNRQQGLRDRARQMEDAP